MANRDQYNPDYEKLYPGAKITPEVAKALQQSDRKMKYMEVEIKHGVFRQDLDAKTAQFTLAREDSLERLFYDESMEFVSHACLKTACLSANTRRNLAYLKKQ